MTPEQAAILLATSRAFLRAHDHAALAAEIGAALDRLVQPWKWTIGFLDHDGRLRIVAHSGVADEELAMIRGVIDEAGSLAARVVAGGELWSDIDAAARGRIAAYAARSGFAVPIVGESGVVGTFSAMFPDERSFDDRERDTFRQLAAQAGLAFELLASRAALERERHDSSRDAQLAGMLLRVSEGLAGLTDTATVTRAMGDALLESTGASMAVVGRFDGERFAIVAAAGLSRERLGLLGRLEPVTASFGLTRELAAGRMVALQAPIAEDMFPAALVGSMIEMQVAPIFLAERVWGFLGVGVRAADAFLADRGEALLTGLATIAATALARAEAVERLEAQTDVLESAVTERTAQLQEAIAELQLASEAKTDFLANVSHELRTPLTSILGFSELLLAGSEGPLTPGQRDDLETVVRSSRHLMELIDDLIDISRIETGRIELAPDEVDLDRLARTTVEEVRALAGAKGVAMTVEPGSPVVVQADPARVHEIVLNLLSNAVKFTPASGAVRITVQGDDLWGTVEVSDTGIGIAAIDHERVFEKFARLGGPQYAGTGLGLAISRELARLHGGDVTVGSTLGLGSRFCLRLPRRIAPPARAGSFEAAR
jgi:signal transduction histidine kinase